MSDVPPFWNLWDVCGTLFILGLFAFLFWLLGGLSLKFVLLIVVLFFAAVHFAKKGSGR